MSFPFPNEFLQNAGGRPSSFGAAPLEADVAEAIGCLALHNRSGQNAFNSVSKSSETIVGLLTIGSVDDDEQRETDSSPSVK